MGDGKRKPQIKWDAARRQFLIDNYPSMEIRPLTEEFNRRFGHSLTKGAIGQKIHEIGIKKRSTA